ncbi:MAG: hypothetical protein GC154_20555 [bacterium]|nr:hypothetical protein [bacterium]
MKHMAIHSIIRKSMLIVAAAGFSIAISVPSAAAAGSANPVLAAHSSKLLGSRLGGELPGRNGAPNTNTTRESALSKRFQSSKMLGSRLGGDLPRHEVAAPSNGTSHTKVHTAKAHVKA